MKIKRTLPSLLLSKREQRSLTSNLMFETVNKAMISTESGNWANKSGSPSRKPIFQSNEKSNSPSPNAKQKDSLKRMVTFAKGINLSV